ncbi:hypothetical protein B0H21DRAFT_843644 [Amylocystis lapponica]|nr:hypothetical protein B0H21DRAFT_843644 [Amylocystis lapponica]
MAESKDSLPRTLLAIPGVSALLTEGGDMPPPASNLASSVLELASAFRLKASDHRIGIPNTGSGSTGIKKPQATSLPGSLVKIRPGIAAFVKQERKDKKVQSDNNLIKLNVSVWETPFLEDDSLPGKMIEIANVRASDSFSPETPTLDAVEGLLKQVQEGLAQTFGNSRRQLNWSNVSFYSHAAATKFSNLEKSHIHQGTVADLLRHFTSKSLGGKAQLKEKTVEIRFSYFSKDIQLLDTEMGSSSQPSAVISTRAASKRKVSVSAGGDELRSAAGRRTLKSAYILPKTYSRSPPMKSLSYCRIGAVDKDKTCEVKFTTQDKPEGDLQIATDWEAGEALSRSLDPYEHTGYVGSGFSKIAIYARAGGKEYVLTQYSPASGSEENNRFLLQEEFRLLVMGNTLKQHFDEHVKTSQADAHDKIIVPSFQFHLKGAIFGRLELSIPDSGRLIPFRHFIATPLLPCGPHDAPVRKFTGNETLNPPKDNLEEAVHAFSHFVWLWSRNDIFMCDLQGMFDRYGTLCLFDPQCHRGTTKPFNMNSSVHWDGGPSAIASLMKEHMTSCPRNTICRALDLANLEVEDDEEIDHVETSSVSINKVLN